MPRSSKELARRLRFHRYPVADAFRRHWAAAAAGAALAGVGLWVLLYGAFGSRQYLPGPVSRSHASFGDRCQRCHDSVHGVSDGSCLLCHDPRVHAEHESGTPRCARCHDEHRAGEPLLDVADDACTDCHADLRSEGGDLKVERSITSFAAHPVDPLRDGRRDNDKAQLRFNHKAHLEDSSCADCHQVAADGGRMQPIRFEKHCAESGCHAQQVGGPLGKIKLLHGEPERVREDLRAKLLAAAVSAGPLLGDEVRTRLRELGVADAELLAPDSLTTAEVRTLQYVGALSLTALEAKIYDPKPDDPKLGCFYCHAEEGPHQAAPALPKIAAPDVPSRWLQRSEFSHRRHQQMKCVDCHARVQASTAARDTNLPDLSTCMRCHADGARSSAGTRCVSCHRYHDPLRGPWLRQQSESGPVAAHRRDVGIACLTGGECEAGSTTEKDSEP